MEENKIENFEFDYPLGDMLGQKGCVNLSAVLVPGKMANDDATLTVYVVFLGGEKKPIPFSITKGEALEISVSKDKLYGKYPVKPAGETESMTIDSGFDLKVGLANDIFGHGRPYQAALVGGNDTRDSGIKNISFLAGDLALTGTSPNSNSVKISFNTTTQKTGTIKFQSTKKEHFAKGTVCAKDFLRVPYWGINFDQEPLSCKPEK